MRPEYPRVRLGEVLTPVPRPVRVEAGATYREIGIRSHGLGIFHKEPVSGADLGSKKVFYVEPGDFVLNIVFAWEGAVALVSEREKGMIGSHRFPTFRPRDERLDLGFLLQFLRTSEGRRMLERVSPGGAGRNRTLSKRAFLNETIPLPPTSDQRHCIDVIEQTTARVQEALRLANESDATSLLAPRSVLLGTEWPSVKLGRVLHRRPLDIIVEAETEYEFAGVYSFGRGLFRGQRKAGHQFSYRRLTRIRAGNFLYPKLMAWEGAFAVVPDELEDLVVSPEFPVFEVDTAQLLPEVLEVFFRTPNVWTSFGSTGTNVRRKRLHPKTLLAADVPIPPRPVQEQIKHLVRTTRACSEQRASVIESLELLQQRVVEEAVRGNV